jgi:alpha-glucosidase
MSVVSFSPLQWIFWYDSPRHYRGEKEIEFFKEVKTVWDETRVLEGSIGEYATIARRSGDQWFVGMINAEQPRQTKLALDFLSSNQEYDATVYYDDPELKTRTNVGIRSQEVTGKSSIEVDLIESGGAAIWIRPKSD